MFYAEKHQATAMFFGALLILVSCQPVDIRSTVIAVPSSEVLLSDGWRFTVDVDQAGERRGWYKPDFDDVAWEAVQVPHTWNVDPRYLDFSGLGWYRLRFKVPPEAQDGVVRLRFEAVFYRAQVWVNGRQVGEHEGGYTPFELDITGSVKPGQVALLAVQADNRRGMRRLPADLGQYSTYDWWNYGGIVREVRLVTTSRVVIAGQRILSHPHLTGEDQADSARLEVQTTLRNYSTQAWRGKLSGNVLDESTGEATLTTPLVASVEIPAGKTVQVKLSTDIPSPRLWHFDHPNLYRWSASLQDDGGQVFHQAEDTFGIRSIELKEARFLLNGEAVRLVGLTRHADSPQAGLAETVTIMLADYNELKTLNQVFTRPVHYPQSKYILDFADRNGILLIPEVPSWGLLESHLVDRKIVELEKQQLGEMITADFNHPSVWAWSIANEIASDTPGGVDFVQEMVRYVKSLDPSRPVGFACNRLSYHPENDATRLTDFVMMNQYIGTWAGAKDHLAPVLDAIHRAWPDRVVVISEFGFEPNWNATYTPSEFSANPGGFYTVPKGTHPNSPQVDQVRRQVIIDQMEVFRSKPFIAGAIFWTYQDYRTPTGFRMGVVDFERKHSLSWEEIRTQFAPAHLTGVEVLPPAAGAQKAILVIKTRGPLEEDMPVYTLRGYFLRYRVISPDGETVYSQGDTLLPSLAPATEWRGELEWTVPDVEYQVVLSLVRPTGYSVLDYKIVQLP